MNVLLLAVRTNSRLPHRSSTDRFRGIPESAAPDWASFQIGFRLISRCNRVNPLVRRVYATFRSANVFSDASQRSLSDYRHTFAKRNIQLQNGAFLIRSQLKAHTFVSA